MKKLKLFLLIALCGMQIAYCQDPLEPITPRYTITEIQLRNCLEYRELYLDTKLKMMAVSRIQVSTDSLYAVTSEKLTFAKLQADVLGKANKIKDLKIVGLSLALVISIAFNIR
jgi:hypothetical protein